MRKYFFIPILLIPFSVSMLAQQTPFYSQYILNEFIINPSVAGIDGMTTINFSGRKQWFGWDYSPSTFSACVSTRLLKSDYAIRNRFEGPNKYKKGSTGNVGLGGALIADKNGATGRLEMNLTYSYHIFIQNSQLSFGLSLLAQQFKIDRDLADFDPTDNDGTVDPLEGLLGKSAYIPDGAFGVNYSSHFYSLGFSVFQLFQSPVKFGDMEVNYRQLKHIRQYNLIASYNNKFKTNPDWEYEPSVIIRTTENLQPNADISMRIIYNREYWAGLSYRTSGEFIMLLGVKLNRFYFGYSFDYGFNEISRLTYGSHEVMLAIKLGDSARRYRYWERY